MEQFPVTTYTPLKVKFGWTLQDWKSSPSYVISKRLGEQCGGIESPVLHAEGNSAWQFTIRFENLNYNSSMNRAQAVYDQDIIIEEPFLLNPRTNSKMIFGCQWIKKPTHKENEMFAVEGTVRITSSENEEFALVFEVISTLSDSSNINNTLEYTEIDAVPNVLTLTADFTIFGRKQTSNIPGLGATPELTSLAPFLAQLCEDLEFTDLTIAVGGEEIAAHRAVLAARSPVLKVMLSTNMKEKQEAKIEITDVSCAVWQIFQKFLYTDVFDPGEECNMDSLLEILMLSDKYEVLSLKQRAGEFILSHLSPENVLDAYEAGHKFSVPGLQETARDIILANWETLRKEKKVLAWIATGSDLASSIFEKLRV